MRKDGNALNVNVSVQLKLINLPFFVSHFTFISCFTGKIWNKKYQFYIEYYTYVMKNKLLHNLFYQPTQLKNEQRRKLMEFSRFSSGK